MVLIILALVALLCLTVTVRVYERFWDYGLSASVAFDREQIEEGQGVVLKEIVENNKILPLLMLSVKFRLERNIRYLNGENSRITDKQYRNDCVSVMPYQRVTRSFPAVGTGRGFYSVEEVNLVATDLLFRKILAKDVKNQTWLYVYPARSRLMGLPEIYRRMYGDCLTDSLQQEDPFAFKGIRDYTGTEPMRKVNWKASARTGTLKVNQYYDNSSRMLTIFLNVAQKGILKQDDLIEESIRVARSFLEWFVQRGIPIRMFSNGVDKVTGQELAIREGAGLSHIDACLKQLARLETHGPVRDMEELLLEQKRRNGQQDGEISLLISAEQSAGLAGAYLDYAGADGKANWLIPIHISMERYLMEHVGKEKLRGNSGNRIHIEYLVMEDKLGAGGGQNAGK